MRLKNYPYPQSCKLLINKNMSFLSLCPQKNQYDKMEEKKLCGAEKQFISIEGQGHVERKKNVPRNGRINVSKQKKIKLRLLEDNHERIYIIQFFMFPERILP